MPDEKRSARRQRGPAERRDECAQRSAGRRCINGRMVAVDAPLHGKGSTYTNWQCRCVECTTANTVEQGERRARRWERTRRNGGVAPGAVAHGRATTYLNWGCRCCACLTAARRHDRARVREPRR